MSGFVTGHTKLVPQPLPADAASFRVTSLYRVLGDGTVEARIEIIPSGANLVLPRVGLEFQLPSAFQNFTYLGRGPHENVVDRNHSAFLGRYEAALEDFSVPYAKPMDCGSRTGVRWIEVRAGARGIRFEARKEMIATPSPYRAMEMVKAPHLHDLPKSSGTFLTLDARQLGVGQSSCGPPPLERDRVRMDPVIFEFRMRGL